jgi:hypothetical protein
MSAYNEAQTLSSSIDKKAHDTAEAIIRNIRG